MTDREVRVRERCRDCEKGVVQSSTWAEFYADESFQREVTATRAARNYEIAADMEMRWFRERGYLRSHDRLGENLPPEEEPCFECEGTGWVERWAGIAEIARDLGIVEEASR